MNNEEKAGIAELTDESIDELISDENNCFEIQKAFTKYLECGNKRITLIKFLPQNNKNRLLITTLCYMFVNDHRFNHIHDLIQHILKKIKEKEEK